MSINVLPINAHPLGRVRLSFAFSLVEVVLALGLMSFCLLSVVGLMASAQRAHMEANERTTMSLILQSANGLLSVQPFVQIQTALANPGGIWMGFEKEGRYLGRANSAIALDSTAFFRVEVRPANAAAGTNSFHIRASATISYPPPNFDQTMSFPISLVRYGSEY